MAPYRETIAKLDELLSRRKPSVPRMPKVSATPPPPDYKSPPARQEEPPIVMDHGMIIVNYEVATYCYYILQKFANTTVREKLPLM
jgi:hypothetical protein